MAAFSRIALLLVAALGLGGRAVGGEGAAVDVELKAVLVAASGRSEKPEFDPKIPAGLKEQIKQVNLAYGRYELLEIQQKGTRFGGEATFSLPDKESLAIKPTVDETSTRRARLAYRLLDGKGKVMVVSTIRVAYGRSFLIHRAKGESGLLMGVSANKPAKP